MPRISYQQIQQNIAEIANRDAYESTVIYDLLLAYGKPKATITKLQGGINNFAKDEGVLLKDAVFFKVFPAGTVLESKVEQLKHDVLTERYRPRYLIVTDLQNIAAYDRRQEVSLSIKIRDLDKDFTFFYGLSGNEVNTGQKEEAYADRKAAERMKELYDEIVKCNTQRIIDKDLNFRHDLNIFFSRLLFCYFAEDTDLFEPKQFTNSIKNYTKLDGSDTPYFFKQLFKSLDSKPYEKQGMPDPFNKFPYVNGTIFDTKQHSILIPQFNAQAHHLLIQLAESDWSDVNPDIFGTIFQGIVDVRKRDENGMDYTSVDNINKVINPLFMNELWGEFDKDFEDDNRIKDKKSYKIDQLNALWNRIANIKVFDPACGSGNFLIITYKALRELEQYIIRKIDELMPTGIGIKLDSHIKLDHFYGIELEDFPRELAVLSMFIAAHQMNIKFEEEFGKKLTIIPIIDMPTIICGNATKLDWNSICPNIPKRKIITSSPFQTALLDVFQEQEEIQTVEYDEIYVIGNPPYKGSKKQTPTMKADFAYYFKDEDYSGNLDYIAIWFIKAARYISGTRAKMAFVSTNSVCQGEHISIMFPKIYDAGVDIDFAYLPFKWQNNAKDNAGVIVCIIGMSNKNNRTKRLFRNQITESVSNISAYLLPTDTNTIIKKHSNPLSLLPKISFGNMPIDGGFLTIEPEEYSSLSEESKVFVRKYQGAAEFINGKERYCIWIEDNDLKKAQSNGFIANRIIRCKQERLKSSREATKKLAKIPWKFGFISHKDTLSIIVPRVSSERRQYIPMGLLDQDTIISDAALAVYDAKPWLFALLQSSIHMAWIRTVCGKMKSDYRYSASLGYNTFPVPPLNLIQKEKLNDSAMNILMARENHTEMTLAQMYDPDKMPEDLRNAHDANDLLVDKLYQDKAFLNDEERLAKLFSMYEELTKDKK